MMQIRIRPDQYQSIVDAEWSLIYEKLAACVALGANIVISKLPIGDLATQYFADRGIFSAGRVSEGDVRRLSRATGASVQSTLTGVSPSDLAVAGNSRKSSWARCVTTCSAPVPRGRRVRFFSAGSGAVSGGGGAVDPRWAFHSLVTQMR